MRYDDSILIKYLRHFANAVEVDKFIRFPHFDIEPLYLVELIEERFHWAGIKSVYLFDDSKLIELGESARVEDIFNIVAIDSDNDLYLFKDEIDFYVYLENDTYLAALEAHRYEVSEEEMSQLIEATREELIERSERTIRAAELRLKRLKGN